ncbi:hypothetical protein WJX73_007124 [Symbiochloris irregularis]|uniref:AP2/ERF domain-containing protein n=1 Tax=Symbiochloris irregularis TaxID=706552 RepID=A0AAW1PI57_9CHLO
MDRPRSEDGKASLRQPRRLMLAKGDRPCDNEGESNNEMASADKASPASNIQKTAASADKSSPAAADDVAEDDSAEPTEAQEGPVGSRRQAGSEQGKQRKEPSPTDSSDYMVIVPPSTAQADAAAAVKVVKETIRRAKAEAAAEKAAKEATAEAAFRPSGRRLQRRAGTTSANSPQQQTEDADMDDAAERPQQQGQAGRKRARILDESDEESDNEMASADKASPASKTQKTVASADKSSPAPANDAAEDDSAEPTEAQEGPVGSRRKAGSEKGKLRKEPSHTDSSDCVVIVPPSSARVAKARRNATMASIVEGTELMTSNPGSQQPADKSEADTGSKATAKTAALGKAAAAAASAAAQSKGKNGKEVEAARVTRGALGCTVSNGEGALRQSRRLAAKRCPELQFAPRLPSEDGGNLRQGYWMVPEREGNKKFRANLETKEGVCAMDYRLEEEAADAVFQHYYEFHDLDLPIDQPLQRCNVEGNAVRLGPKPLQEKDSPPQLRIRGLRRGLSHSPMLLRACRQDMGCGLELVVRRLSRDRGRSLAGRPSSPPFPGDCERFPLSAGTSRSSTLEASSQGAPAVDTGSRGLLGWGGAAMRFPMSRRSSEPA